MKNSQAEGRRRTGRSWPGLGAGRVGREEVRARPASSGSMGREKITSGRKVTPTSLLPAVGATPATVSGMGAAGSGAGSGTACCRPHPGGDHELWSPAVSMDRSSAWLKARPCRRRPASVPPSKA